MTHVVIYRLSQNFLSNFRAHIDSWHCRTLNLKIYVGKFPLWSGIIWTPRCRLDTPILGDWRPVQAVLAELHRLLHSLTPGWNSINITCTLDHIHRTVGVSCHSVHPSRHCRLLIFSLTETKDKLPRKRKHVQRPLHTRVYMYQCGSARNQETKVLISRRHQYKQVQNVLWTATLLIIIN